MHSVSVEEDAVGVAVVVFGRGASAPLNPHAVHVGQTDQMRLHGGGGRVPLDASGGVSNTPGGQVKRVRTDANRGVGSDDNLLNFSIGTHSASLVQGGHNHGLKSGTAAHERVTRDGATSINGHGNSVVQLKHVTLDSVTGEGDAVRVTVVAAKASVSAPRDNNIVGAHATQGNQGGLERSSAGVVINAGRILGRVANSSTGRCGGVNEAVAQKVTSSRDGASGGDLDGLNLREPQTNLSRDGLTGIRTNGDLLDLGNHAGTRGNGLHLTDLTCRNANTLHLPDVQGVGAAQVFKRGRQGGRPRGTRAAHSAETQTVHSLDPAVVLDTGAQARNLQAARVIALHGIVVHDGSCASSQAVGRHAHLVGVSQQLVELDVPVISGNPVDGEGACALPNPATVDGVVSRAPKRNPVAQVQGTVASLANGSHNDRLSNSVEGTATSGIVFFKLNNLAVANILSVEVDAVNVPVGRGQAVGRPGNGHAVSSGGAQVTNTVDRSLDLVVLSIPQQATGGKSTSTNRSVIQRILGGGVCPAVSSRVLYGHGLNFARVLPHGEGLGRLVHGHGSAHDVVTSVSPVQGQLLPGVGSLNDGATHDRRSRGQVISATDQLQGPRVPDRVAGCSSKSDVDVVVQLQFQGTGD